MHFLVLGILKMFHNKNLILSRVCFIPVKKSENTDRYTIVHATLSFTKQSYQNLKFPKRSPMLNPTCRSGRLPRQPNPFRPDGTGPCFTAWRRRRWPRRPPTTQWCTSAATPASSPHPDSPRRTSRWLLRSSRSPRGQHDIRVEKIGPGIDPTASEFTTTYILRQRYVRL
jgi:hypothetical protein